MYKMQFLLCSKFADGMLMLTSQFCCPNLVNLTHNQPKKKKQKNNMKQEQAFFLIFYVFRSTVDQLP